MFSRNNLEPGCGCQSPSSGKKLDLLGTRSALWLWCLPLGLGIVAMGLWYAHVLSFTLTGVIVTLTTAWIGGGCYLNGRNCGRTHCKIDGILLPLLSLVGLFNLLGVISLSWNGYANAFWIIVLISYVPEWLGLKYLPQKGGM